MIDFLGDNFEKMLEDTFFFKRPIRKLPDSVIALTTKEWMYDYESPDSVLFWIIASEYSLPPHELLKYTLDEMYYLFEALQYKNLNDNQKKELQRIKKAKEIMAQKPLLDEKVKELEDYFSKNQ